ncbi:type II toxin-antitoxin system VapC family toxin [Spirosoma gilvum]
MIYFFDSSALVKYYTNEKGTEQVTAIIQDPDTYIFISQLACIEIKSSLATKCRTSQIDHQEWLNAMQAFEESLTNFYIEPISREVCRSAEQLIQTFAVRHSLRTLDSIQLATFQQLPYPTVILASADERMNGLARELGYITWNPNTL